MKYIPKANKVLLKVEKLEFEEKKSDGGIIVEWGNNLDRKQLSLTEGIVMAFGPLAWEDLGSEDQIQIREKVKFVELGGRAIMDEGDKPGYPTLRMVNSIDIYARIEE